MNIKFLIDFFTEIDVCLLPVEIWPLIVTYLPITDMFHLYVCSKLFHAVAHENACLDEKMNISKRLISNNLMFFGQFRCLFCQHYKASHEN